MAECDLMRESMPFLLTESLDSESRERTHRHIEGCAECSQEWLDLKGTWQFLAELPEVEVPSRVRDRFLAEVLPPANVVSITSRRWVRYVAQAAAVVFLVGGSYWAGGRTAPIRLGSSPAIVESVRPIQPALAPFSIAENRVLQASSVSPNIEGRPNIENVQFVNGSPNDDQIGVSFDITSHVTVNGKPTDKSMVRLLSYVLENEDRMSPSRSRAIDWVRAAYSDPAKADPEIAKALANVLRNDEHQGVRIKAVDTLKSLPPSLTADTRQALIEALKSDPNPAVRLKAVEALARLASSGEPLDAAALDTLRQKAGQDDEVLYVRVKAAEALSHVRP
ncbi:MAG TPA: HEAT repeat domain-containing protein [Thermoanaerobaculia bacterium]|nr:HEAT repeat domain-containing protein [Thermoanaerobaculia bacterium]